MLDRLIDRLFWDRRLTPRLRAVWLTLILLAPLAMSLSVWLQRRVLASVPVRIEVDRNDAIRIATEFAAGRGIDTSGFSVRLRAHEDWRLYRYLAAVRPDLMNRLGLWGFLQVRLAEPGGSERAEVKIEPHGNVLGHQFILRDMSTRPFTLEQARELAGQALSRRRGEWPFVTAGDPEVTAPKEATTAGGYLFRWPLNFQGMPGLSAQLSVRVQHGRVVEESLEPKLAGGATEGLRTVPRSLSAIPFMIYVVLLFFYVLYRFIRRRIHKEVSGERLWLVAVLVSLVFTGIRYLSDPFEFSDMAAWTGPAILAGGGLLIGLLGGMFYSACEGDLRENYPNAFTSLDAVLSGRLFSRNAGRALVLGAVLVSWAFLVRNAIFLVVRPRFAGLDALESSFDFLFTRVPSLAVLLQTPGAALGIGLIALLCPLAALDRFFGKKKRTYVLLALLAWFSVGMVLEEALSLTLSAGPQGDSISANAGISDEAISVLALSVAPLVISLALVWSFFAVDFLCSFTVLVGWQLLSLAGLSQVAPIWSRHDDWAAAMGGGVLLAAVYGVWRGRVAEAIDVRPVYARQIEERQQLESEMAAASEAQRRLLPSTLPSIPGLSIAAVCRPAETVSGDFYDFYRVSPQRTGVLLIDGGGSGLATALAIALAKGYLMHKTESGAPAAETLSGLIAMLGDELRGVTARGMCYALIDQAEHTVRYARLGETPAILGVGQVTSVERTHGAGSHTIFEGVLRVSAGHPVVCYTKGLSRAIGEADPLSTNRWLQHRMRAWQESADRLMDRMLVLALGRKANRQLKEDLTLLVISVSSAESPAVERVA